jgi:hypothetical protein
MKNPDATLTRAVLTKITQKGGKTPHALLTITTPLDQEFYDIAALLAACVEADSVLEVNINIAVRTPAPQLQALR